MYRPVFIVRSKIIRLVFISSVTFMMITSGSFHLVLADLLHCDIEGWPSCYSVDYSHGLVNPGTSCPSGHSSNPTSVLYLQSFSSEGSNLEPSSVSLSSLPSLIKPGIIRLQVL
jgi:hypothetical protein